MNDSVVDYYIDQDIDASVCSHCGIVAGMKASATSTEQNLIGAPCGHSLCTRCIDRAYLNTRLDNKPSLPSCPVCTAALPRHKAALRTQGNTQTPAQQEYTKEIAVRKRLQSIFNKRREDFGPIESETASQDYNDYLEKVELYVANLVTGTNLQQTEKEIKGYEREQARIISKNASRIQKEKAQIEESLLQAAKVRLAAERTRKSEDMQRKYLSQHNQETEMSIALGDFSAEEAKSSSVAITTVDRGVECQDIGKPPLAQIQPPQVIDTKPKMTVIKELDEVIKSYDRETIVETIRRAAGGFDTQACVARQMEEAMSTLLM